MPTYSWQGRWAGATPVGSEHRRAREVISPSGGIVRGKFPSRKNGRMVHHEGLLELEAIYLFETSQRVMSYTEQPMTVRYPDGPRLRRYTPDFELVLDTDQRVLIEIKPERSLLDPAVKHKLECVARHFERSGIPFVVLTDNAIRQEPRLSNLRKIYHGAARVPPTHTAARVALAGCSDRFPLSLNAASRLLATATTDPYTLLLAGLLKCSLDSPVSIDTVLDIAKEPSDAWFSITQEHGF